MTRLYIFADEAGCFNFSRNPGDITIKEIATYNPRYPVKEAPGGAYREVKAAIKVHIRHPGSFVNPP